MSAEGDVYHQSCWQIVVSEAKVTQAPLRSEHWSDPICPVCLQPIARSDMVMGRRDRLVHAQCDPRPPQEPSTLG